MSMSDSGFGTDLKGWPEKAWLSLRDLTAPSEPTDAYKR